MHSARETASIDRATDWGHDAAMLIYKIFRAPETRGAPIDLADGYIHFSTGAMLFTGLAHLVSPRSRNSAHFASAHRLILLALESEDFEHYLKWEPSRGGALFPHLYRALRMQDVMWQSDLPLGPNGHVFPKGVL